MAEGFHVLGLLPLIWAATLTAWRKRLDSEWWMIALGYAVSWVADSANDAGDVVLYRNAYVMLQAGLIAAVLVDTKDALRLVALYAGVGMLAVWVLGAANLLPLHTICWLTVAGLALRTDGLARLALVASFGFGWLVWLPFYAHPTFATWGIYQCSRLLGSVLLICAMRSPFPASRICGGSIRLSPS